MEYDAIICGAGPAGLATGISTLYFKKDARVLILESREEVGEEKCAEGLSEDWFKHMKAFGRFVRKKLSSKCFDNPMFGFVLVLPSGKKIVVKSKKQQGWILDKDYFLKNLAEIFKRMRGELKTNVKVQNPVVKNGVVYGVETDNGEFIKGKFIVDATGLNQIIWRKALNIKEPMDRKDLEVCYQYKVEGCKLEDPHSIYVYFGSDIAPGGYGWVFPKSKGRANVGVGCQASRVASAVPFQENFWKLLNLGGKIVSKKGGTVSTFNLPENFVWSNLACVGSSARFTCPAHGGGTGPALFGGYLLGKHMARALKRKVSIREALKNYQAEIKEIRGKDHEYHYRAKNLLQSCSDEELEIIFSSIQPKEWLKIMSIKKGEVLKILKRIFKKNFRLGLRVVKYLGLKM